MKKIITLAFLLVLYGYGMSQVQVQASIGIGNAPNRIKVYLKSPQALDNKNLASLQFDIALPDNVNPKPNVIVKTWNAALAPAGWTMDGNAGFSEDGFFHYPIVPANIGNYNISLPANAEVEVLEIEFTEGQAIPSDVYLMFLGDKFGINQGGGNTFQAVYNFSANLQQFTSQLEAQGFFYTRADNDPQNHFTTVQNNLSLSTNTISFAKLNGGVLLPVKYTGFTAVKDGSAAKLNWTVEGENDLTDLYEVQISNNGVDFTALTEVDATPKENGSNSYTLTNVRMNNSVTYYRIKQLDKNGKFAYSEIRSIKNGNSSAAVVGLYPNPVVDRANLTMDLAKPSAVKVTVNNASGQAVQQLNINAAAGISSQKVDFSKLSAGRYTVQVFIGTASPQVISVIKK